MLLCWPHQPTPEDSRCGRGRRGRRGRGYSPSPSPGGRDTRRKFHSKEGRPGPHSAAQAPVQAKQQRSRGHTSQPLGGQHPCDVKDSAREGSFRAAPLLDTDTNTLNSTGRNPQPERPTQGTARHSQAELTPGMAGGSTHQRAREQAHAHTSTHRQGIQQNPVPIVIKFLSKIRIEGRHCLDKAWPQGGDSAVRNQELPCQGQEQGRTVPPLLPNTILEVPANAT